MTGTGPQSPPIASTAGGPPTDKGDSFVRPAGFSPWHGQSVSDSDRLLSLVGVFVRDLRRGLMRTLLWLAFLLPPVGMAIYVWVRTQVQAFAIAGPEQAAFAVQNLSLSFMVGLAWALLLQAGMVAPTIARDIRFGALLLYFSRPVRRRHYLIGRALAGTLLVAMGLAIPLILLVLVHVLAMGVTPGGAGELAWAFWPLALVGAILASLLAAFLSTVVGLACGVVARNPGLVPMLFGGGVLGSVGLSWVGQLIWERNSLARSVDLHHALEAPLTFALRLIDPADAPEFVMLDAGAGLGLWVALAVVAWLLLERFVADPPLGRGRS
ncbi:MAG: hypothetical protein KC502_07980 [Myxococcales bacterium]|nr:hypothetical protein [Myxococcales bacterium]